MKTPTKKTSTRKRLVRDGDPRSLSTLMLAYLEHGRMSRLSEATAEVRDWHLAAFVEWCKERDVVHAVDVTRQLCERYQRYLFHYRKQNGAPLAVGSQRERLSALRVFFRWATKKNHTLYNPASELELKRKPQRLPRAVLSSSEVEEIMVVPDLSLPSGVRDRAMLETLYSTGIRRVELLRLLPSDVDLERGTLFVREGKGKKDRMVPCGERACAFVRKYLDEARPFLAVDDDVDELFLRDDGGRFDPDQLTMLVHRYVERSGIKKSGACHLFRHTMATLMLEGGADIRFIQAMLGHADLSSTELYTRVAIGKLKEVHAATHPSAKLKRKKAAKDLFAALEAEESEEDVDDASP